MIDKQSLLNDPSIKWQSVADKKWGTYGDVEENALRSDAGKRIRALVGQTEFIGKGGAKVNLDGTYEVMADAGSEVLTDKLKEMLQKTFEEDEELNRVLDQLKAMHAAKKERTASAPHTSDEAADPAKDTFTPSEQAPAASNKWREQEQITKALIDKANSSWYYLPMPGTTPDSVRRMEDWLLNGAPFPDNMMRVNMGPINPKTGCSENITLVNPNKAEN